VDWEIAASIKPVTKIWYCEGRGEMAMIARVWRGVTPAARADEYAEYLRATGIPEYRETRATFR
jgi:hypothetical protein